MCIDPQGNIEVDFDGYPDRTCVREEQKLREILGDFGLEIDTVSTSPKEDHSGPAARITGKRKVGL